MRFKAFPSVLLSKYQDTNIPKGHDRFLPRPFQFIIRYDPIILRYSVWVIDSVVK